MLSQLTKKYKANYGLLDKIFQYAAIVNIKKSTVINLDELFFKLLEIHSIQGLIECGANEASASKRFVNNGYKAIAIEANPFTAENLFLNSNEMLKVINIGLSDKEETLNFYYPKGSKNAGSAGFLKKDKIEYEKISVQANTLDNVIKNESILNTPFACWIDLEGFQDQFLKGAKKSLSLNNCKFLKIEVEDKLLYKDQKLDSTGVNKYLDKLGYVPIFRDFEYQYQYNCIYIKNELIDLTTPYVNEYIEKSISKNLNFIKLLKILSNKNHAVTQIKFFLQTLFGDEFVARIKCFFKR